MGIFDAFKIKDYKEQISKLEIENKQLQEKASIALTMQQMEPGTLQELINQKKDELVSLEKVFSNRKNESTTKIDELTNQQTLLQSKITRLQQEISECEGQLTSVKDDVSMEDGSYVKNPDIKVRTNLTFNLNYLI